MIIVCGPYVPIMLLHCWQNVTRGGYGVIIGY